jgi:hypothetical protein
LVQIRLVEALSGLRIEGDAQPLVDAGELLQTEITKTLPDGPRFRVAILQTFEPTTRLIFQLGMGFDLG